MKYPKPTTKELLRFLTKINFQQYYNCCWLWARFKDKDGYGQFTINKQNRRAQTMFERLVTNITKKDFSYILKYYNIVDPRNKAIDWIIYYLSEDVSDVGLVNAVVLCYC